MKKLSLIVAMAVVLTIGGVFATWTYADDDIAAKTYTKQIGMEDATSGSASAVITEVTNDLTLTVNNAGEFVPVLNVSGSIVAKLVIDPTAPDDITDGVQLQWELIENTDPGNLFTVTSGTTTLGDIGNNETVTITAEMIKNKITLDVTDKLDTSAKHGVFKGKLDQVSLTVKISVA